MPTLTAITGYLYNSVGVALTTGKLYLTLQQDMISVDGTKVVPMVITVNLATATPAGYVNISVYATVGASPSGLSYRVEFDPDPGDVTKPMRQKDGYWYNYWAVPNVASVAVGSFSSALRGAATSNYIPLGAVSATAGALVGYVITVVEGVPRKIPYYAV